MLNINQKEYSFDNFIVSGCNEEAYNLCKDFSKDATGKFLALYGPVSCGKSHLVGAVINAYGKLFSDRRILEISYINFAKEFTEAILEKRRGDFWQKICNYDLIVIDNMQFAAGKTDTQIEIAVLLSRLLNEGKSILVTFDAPFQVLRALLDEVNKNNSDKYMAAEINAPDEKVRRACLNVLLSECGFSVSETIQKHLVYADNIPLCAFNGIMSKLKMINEQNICEITFEEAMKAISDYKQS